MQLPPGVTLIRARDNLTHVQPQVFPKLTMHTLLRPYFKASALPCFEPPTEILDTLYWCALNIHLSFSLVRRVHSLTPLPPPPSLNPLSLTMHIQVCTDWWSNTEILLTMKFFLFLSLLWHPISFYIFSQVSLEWVEFWWTLSTRLLALCEPYHPCTMLLVYCKPAHLSISHNEEQMDSSLRTDPTVR